jgi:hypothetical protein
VKKEQNICLVYIETHLKTDYKKKELRLTMTNTARTCDLRDGAALVSSEECSGIGK